MIFARIFRCDTEWKDNFTNIRNKALSKIENLKGEMDETDHCQQASCY